jgi:predicted dehydrogenase
MARVGLVGYGMAGREIHAPALTEAGLDVAAIVTANEERVAAARGEYPEATIFATLDAMLEEGGLDLVVVASPNVDHLANATAIIDAGIPLVVDKPLGITADEALEIVDRAERAGVPLTVFQNRRYDPQYRTLAEVVRSGGVGEPFRLELRWERWRPEPLDRWRENLTGEEGGGIMLDLFTHLVDIAVRLFGDVETVFATVSSRSTRGEDDAFVVARHESGVESHLGATSLAAAPGPRTRLLGRSAAYVQSGLAHEPATFADLADDDTTCGYLYRGAGERTPVARVDGRHSDFYREVGQALASADPATSLPVDPRDAVHVLAVIDAARVSAQDERVVEVITPGERPD